MCFNVPQDKIQNINIAHSLASIVGQILSMSLGIGPVCCLWTRAVESVINKRTGMSGLIGYAYHQRLKMSLDCVQHHSKTALD